MNEQVPNIHIGLCGLCGGNVTHQVLTMPMCEQCGAETVSGPVLPMKAAAQLPLGRDKQGHFTKSGDPLGRTKDAKEILRRGKP